MRFAAGLCAVAAAAALTGCGSGGGRDDAAPRATLQRYFGAVAAQRPQAACAELTAASRERLAEFAKPLRAGGEGCEATMRVVLASRYGRRLARLAHPVIHTLAVTGRHATARVDGIDTPVELTRENADWRIEFTPSVEADKLPGSPQDDGKDTDAEQGDG